MVSSNNTLLEADTITRLSDQHFDRIGLDWRRRARMLHSRDTELSALAAADARMGATAEAFIHLGVPAARRSLHRLHEPITARDLFAATVQAVLAGESHLFAACMDVASTLPGLRTAFLDAADWTGAVSLDATVRAWRHMSVDGSTHDIQLLFALASLRTPALGETAITWAAPLLRAATARSALLAPALELARLYRWAHWDTHAQQALAHADVEVRAAAVRHLLVAGSARQRQQAFKIGAAIATQPGPCGDGLIGPLMLEARDQVMPILMKLRTQPSLWRRFIDALAWHGDARSVAPLLRPLLADPMAARRAAAAITVLTGSDPRKDGWEAPPPAPHALPDAALPVTDPERGWPWPQANAFDQWWAQNRTRFEASVCLLGRTPSAPNLVHHLLHAPLRWRPIAAWRLHQLDPRCAFATDLPAQTQHAYLNRISESIHERT